jgi:hypothetical protein
MSRFVLAFDIEQKGDVMARLKRVPGIVVAGIPQADGPVIIRTTTRKLDDETLAIRGVEEIPGVIDLRLLD